MAEKRTNYYRQMNEVVIPFFDSSARETFLGRGGVSLKFARFQPASFSEDSVCFVIVPGRTESFFKYAETIFDLTCLGHEVFAFDHRGQGYSARLLENRQMGFVESFADYVADLKTFLEEIVAPKKSATRTFLLAHSMGASVSLALSSEFYGSELALSHSAMQQLCLSGMILSAPMLGIRLDYPSRIIECALVLRCLFGQGRSYVVANGDFQPASYGDDLSFCTDRLGWYRSALAERTELQLGMPSNLWMLRALRFCSKLRSHLKKFPVAASILLLKPEKDTVVEQKFWGLVKVAKPGFELRIEDLPEAGHDPFIETDALRDKLLRALREFVQS